MVQLYRTFAMVQTLDSFRELDICLFMKDNLRELHLAAAFLRLGQMVALYENSGNIIYRDEAKMIAGKFIDAYFRDGFQFPYRYARMTSILYKNRKGDMVTAIAPELGYETTNPMFIYDMYKPTFDNIIFLQGITPSGIISFTLNKDTKNFDFFDGLVLENGIKDLADGIKTTPDEMPLDDATANEMLKLLLGSPGPDAPDITIEDPFGKETEIEFTL
jgi:hypothetical protein